MPRSSGVDSGGAGGARAPPEFGFSEKGRSLISAITASTSGFEKLSTALRGEEIGSQFLKSPNLPKGWKKA